MNAFRDMELRRLTLGRFLRSRRQRAKLTQKDVSDALGYTSPQFVSNWERGVSAPPFDVFPKIVQLFGVSADEVIDAVETYHRTLLQERREELKRTLQAGLRV